MKKYIALLLALVMALSLVACGGSNDAGADSAGSNTGAATNPDSDPNTNDAAANWPERPITTLIPAKVGGDTDTTFRTLSSEINNIIGGTVSLSNLAGGSGAVATAELLNYEADGYTGIWHHYDSILLTMKGAIDQRYDEYLDVAAVIPAVGGEYFLLVNQSSGFETWEDFENYAKAHPGELNWGIETGSYGHLFAQYIVDTTGLDINIVDAGPQADRIAALLGNNIDCYLGLAAELVSYPDDFRAIATSAPNRQQSNPDVPTLVELGYNCVSEKFYFYGFRSGTDPEIVEKMGQAIVEACQTETATEVFTKYGYIEWPVLTGDEALQYLHDFEARYVDLVEYIK